MTYWLPISVDGVSYDLAHLEPFEFQVVPKGWTDPATVSVRFHDHCFTETFDPARHTKPIQTKQASKHEWRAFDADRYNRSLTLPQIVRSLATRRIASTRESNLVFIETGTGDRYVVFFTLRGARRRAELFVVSAYVWTRRDPPATTGEMRFDVALAKVLRGEKPRFPGR
jgi:hypothetical protein